MKDSTGSRRAIVHIGLPRTGTTTLQRVLHGLRPTLAAAGILYPDLVPGSAAELHISHQYLGETLDGRRPRTERSELLDALSHQLATTDADIVLLSYEGLCLASAWLGVPQRLAAVFARHGFAMEVLVTVKPQDELVNSAYTWRTQFLREARRFEDYFRAEIGQPRLDLARLLLPWRRACAGRVWAVPTRDVRSDQPLVQRIFDELGLLPRVAAMIGADQLALVENRSPGPVAVEVARRLRRGGGHLALGRAVRDATRFIEDMARARGLNDAAFMGLDDRMRAAAAARWSRANDRFAQQVWGSPWASRVTPPPAVPSNEVAGQGGPQRQVEEILDEVCRRYQIHLEGGVGLALRDATASVGNRLHRVFRYGRALGW